MWLVKKEGFAMPSLVVLVAFGFVLIAAIGIAFYFYHQYQQTQSLLLQTKKMDGQQALLQAVGKLMVLPANEQPTIATVSDVGRLKGQQFFTNAKNGDKVLIYAKAKEAILYDPVANKIVSVGPIEMVQVTPTIEPSKAIVPVAIALYNGTPIVGYATTIATQLKTTLPQVKVIAKADARENYAQTIVVDLSADKASLHGKYASQAAALAKTLQGKVSSFPQGEAKPQIADILVILGK